MPRIRGPALLLGLVGGCMYHGLDADQGLYLAKWAEKAMIPELGGTLFWSFRLCFCGDVVSKKTIKMAFMVKRIVF